MGPPVDAVTTLAAARVVTPDRVLEPGVVDIEDGAIVAVAPTTGPVPDRTLVPGFVDLQVNGVDDVDVTTADAAGWDRLDGLLAAQGVTTWCPTLITAPLDHYAAPLRRIADAKARPASGRPAIAGAHLEGPFLGGMPGAHPVEHIRPLDGRWLATLPDVVAVVTLAPEQRGAGAAIADLTARGVLPAIGHSDATYEQAVAAVDAGARLVTHCFNAMAPLHHRRPGVLGAALADPRVAVSLIADLVHVHPAALAVALRAKGRGGVALVTDAVAWRADHVGALGIAFDGSAARRADGTLAGSALTMDRAVRNVVARCGLSLVDAIWAASTAPASLLGLDDRGRLAPGTRADVVALDGDLVATATWVCGEQVA